MPITAYISLGSNMGDKKAACLKAIGLLARAGRVVKQSSFYSTEAHGHEAYEDFVNAVVELETELSPLSLLAACHVIEDELGRKRLTHWGPRTIDLDIILYGDQAFSSPELTIPHSLMAARGFVLVPLAEIAPHAKHPVLKKTVVQLLHELRDPHRVTRCDP